MAEEFAGVSGLVKGRAKLTEINNVYKVIFDFLAKERDQSRNTKSKKGGKSKVHNSRLNSFVLFELRLRVYQYIFV